MEYKIIFTQIIFLAVTCFIGLMSIESNYKFQSFLQPFAVFQIIGMAFYGLYLVWSKI